MLGGDNMDLALAHRVEAKLGGTRLDAEQWSALPTGVPDGQGEALGREQPRTLAGHDRRPRVEDHRREHPVGADARRGRARSCSTASSRTRPRARSPVAGGEGRASGIRPAVRRRPGDPQAPRAPSSAATGPRRSAQGGHRRDDRPARPDAILFNGGALTPDFVRDRIVEVVASWFADEAGPAYRPAGPDEHLARPGRRPSARRITGSSGAAAASGSAAARRGRSTSGSSRNRRTAPGSASSRATPRKGTRSRSTTTTSTC